MKLITSFGLKAKLMTAMAFVSIAFGGLAFYSNNTIEALQTKIELLGTQRIAIADTMGNIRSSINAIPRFMWLALNVPAGSPERKKALDQVERNLKILSDNVKEYTKFQLTPEAKAKLVVLEEQVPKLQEAVMAGHALVSKNDAKTDVEAKTVLLTRMPPVAVAMTNLVNEMAEIAQTRNKAIVVESLDSAEKAQNALLIFAGTLGTLLFVIGSVFAFRLSRQLLRITTSVSDASTQVAAASSQLSNASDSLSSASQQQASAIEETSASLTEITGMVEANVRDAERANEVARSVEATSESTRKTMEELNGAMTQILESNRRIEALVKVIEEIGEKTDIIDEIVFKTQLLSFNASVEAERAGDHGRGFAVVAQEVGNLAQMSGKAATEISSIVKTSIKEAEEVARENKSRVEVGGRLALESKEKMATAIEQVRQILEGTRKIVAASKEQSQGIGQISTSVDSLNQTTQETAGTAEESASAGAELSGQSESLLGLVNELAMIVTGSSLAQAQKTSSASPAAHSHSQSHSQSHAQNHDKSKGSSKVLSFDASRKNKAPKATTSATLKAAAGAEEQSGKVNGAHDAGGDGWEKL